MNTSPQSRAYFVDEAGDLTLFDKGGRMIVGQEGVSRCFVVGAALIPDPERLDSVLTSLRAQLLADPYFATVPSMQREAGKTARSFHAKDDTAEVRREVFRILRDSDVEVYAAFRRKDVLAGELREHHRQTGVKLGTERAYDSLVTEIFKNRLHLGDANHIVFARRGKADRNMALQGAIQAAKERFERKWRKGIDRPTTIASSTPSEATGLQVVDYFLWALQRMLEKRDDRYFTYLASHYRLVVDRDDTRQQGFGVYYTASSNPLSLERMLPVT
jgi:Protein of unknown function (DUF3800)